MIGEDHRLVAGEDHVEFAVGQAVRMLGFVLKPHQVDDVDEADLQVGQVLPEQVDGRETPPASGRRRRVAMTTSGSLPSSSVPAHSQIPSPLVQCAIASSMVRKFGLRLLTRDDHVDVLARPQAMVVRGQQRVRVRRQVDPDDLGALVDHMVDEAGVLVAEAVVVLAPDMAGQQVIQARDRPPPRDVVGDLEPLACWLTIESMMWMNAS